MEKSNSLFGLMLGGAYRYEPMAEGTELLRRYVADHSEAAFAALVQQHLPLVYHAAQRRTNGDTHLAEEIAQAVFSNLAREAAALQRHAALAGWLYVATRHAAANAMRTDTSRCIRTCPRATPQTIRMAAAVTVATRNTMALPLYCGGLCHETRKASLASMDRQSATFADLMRAGIATGPPELRDNPR